ncbi:MAG: FAD-dependent oxidoreductase [Candidatus Roizmanbacteria bacterium]|nr:FAD-dependent oxidoreductase [Candidatus Roizmanbacteria bacterium]
MNVAIIGSGFTGLSAAHHLTKNGHTVSIFEKDTKPGGLAVGFKKDTWEWTLEEHYHHWFTNDDSVLSLAREIHFPVIIQRPKTSVFVHDHLYQMDSPDRVLSFPELSAVNRIRMAGSLALLRFNPFWKPLEKYHAESFLTNTMGKEAYDLLWKPQLHNKFGSYAPTISLAWFWARIKKRTPSLAYPEKGYLAFAEALVKHISEKGGVFHFNTEVVSIIQHKNNHSLVFSKNNAKKTEQFDAVLVTLPNSAFYHLAPKLPPTYQRKLQSFRGLGAVNVVLRLSREFMKDGTYWLSVCDPASPVMAIVEHTHFMNKSHYGNEHIVYLGNYVDKHDKRFGMDADDLVTLYDPVLRKINPDYRKHIIGADVFKAPFAQPIIPVNYSRKILPFETPVPQVYLANMQQVYPWDRGTNYAVELGKKVSDAIMKK